MAFFVQLLANYAGLIYIALIVGAVFYLREIIGARQDLQQSLYSLEREAANSRLWRSLLMLGVLGGIAAATFVLSNVVAPQVVAEEATPHRLRHLRCPPTRLLRHSNLHRRARLVRPR